MPGAIRRVFWRLLMFYVLGVRLSSPRNPSELTFHPLFLDLGYFRARAI